MTRSSLGIILFIALLVRTATLFVNLEVSTLPQGGSDAKWLEVRAWEHAEYGREDLSYYLRSNSHFIVLPGSYVYSVTGREPYVLGLLMVLLGVGVVFLSYRAAIELWGDVRTARTVAWVVALFPQLVLHSALFLREMPVTFCLTAAALCAIRYVKYNKLSHVLWFTGWVALGSLFHSGVIIAFPALLLGMILARPRGGRGRMKFYLVNAVSVLILSGTVLIANETGVGLGKFGGSFDEAVDVFEEREMRRTEGAAAFPEWMRVRGGTSDIWKIPIRYVALLFSPLIPFMVRSSNHLLGVVDAALYLYLFWMLYRNWGIVRQSRPAVVILVIMLALFLMYALGVSNFGTAIRHRAKIVTLLIVLAAGLSVLAKRRKRGSYVPPSHQSGLTR